MLANFKREETGFCCFPSASMEREAPPGTTWRAGVPAPVLLQWYFSLHA